MHSNEQRVSFNLMQLIKKIQYQLAFVKVYEVAAAIAKKHIII